MEFSPIFGSCISIFRKLCTSLCYSRNSKEIYTSHCNQIHNELKEYLTNEVWGNDFHIQEVDLKPIEKIISDQLLSLSKKKRAMLRSLVSDLKEINIIIASFLSKRQDFINYITTPGRRIKVDLKDDLSMTPDKKLRQFWGDAKKLEVSFKQQVSEILSKLATISN